MAHLISPTFCRKFVVFSPSKFVFDKTENALVRLVKLGTLTLSSPFIEAVMLAICFDAVVPAFSGTAVLNL